MVITAGVQPSSKLWEVTDLDAFYERAQKYIHVEDGHEDLRVEKSEPLSKPQPMKA